MRTNVSPSPLFRRHRVPALLLALAAAALAGCASKSPAPANYDFGPLPAAASTTAAAAKPAALVMADVSGPAALDSERMHYRLLYADAQQTRPYAYNHWSGTPLQLLTQRLKARVAQAGVKVLAPSDAAAGAMLLRVEVEEFAQTFSSASQSQGSIRLRASAFRNHQLLDQRTFARSSPAASADAGGGARALAEASDALSADLLAWLATLPAAAK
ncbi:cholesterol transport system auxiliary component [Rugamonas rubra]|uniref:Cholesterol transport system auxiliary component n=1 Tax=Rugamonas rubra TaxID=758825 RepID=A0A1I4UTD6_9BURK|nr:cholesterol transport system auxiliary component [Rugamonas rubra]